MPEAYIVDAVRTPVGRRNGGFAEYASGRPGRACHPDAGRARGLRPRRDRRRRLRVPGHHRLPGRRHRPDLLRLAAGPARDGTGRHGRPAVRLLAAGGAFRRPGGDERHRRPGRRRRRAEHEPVPHPQLVHGGRAVRRHGPLVRVEGLAGALRRPGDLAVPRRRDDRREVGFRAARTWRSSRCAATSAPPRRRTRAASTAEIAPFDGRQARTRAPRADTSLEKMAALKTARPGRPADRRGVQPDLRRLGRAADRLGGGGAHSRPHAPGPDPPPVGARRRPGDTC